MSEESINVILMVDGTFRLGQDQPDDFCMKVDFTPEDLEILRSVGGLKKISSLLQKFIRAGYVIGQKVSEPAF